MRLTVRSSAVLRVLRYFVLSFFLVMLQTVVLPRVFPGALPDLMLPAVIAAAMGEDERIAALFGAFGGFFLDAAGTAGLSLSPLYYMLIGYVCGVLIRFWLRRTFLSFMSYVAAATFLTRPVVTYVLLQFSQPDTPLNRAISDILLPEALLTVLAAPLLYLAVLLPLRSAMRRSMKN